MTHALDEIIDEKLTNPDFAWTGKNGIASFLGLSAETLSRTIQTWNEHKILFEEINADALDIDCKIFKIIPGKHGIRCWKRYHRFVDSRGCRLPVDPAILFKHHHHASLLKLLTKQVSVSGLGLSYSNTFTGKNLFSCLLRFQVGAT
jgi:hypothetical protein